MGESFLGGCVFLEAGDCREVLADMPSNMFHACVTDPPYSLVSIAKRFGKPGNAACQYGADGRYARASAGFMGQQWDTGETAFDPVFWAEVLRVLKPGGHLLAMGGTRTFHRLVCAIEDAGFEIRDCVVYAFGSGFPKSHDVSKGIDRALGFEREKVRHGNPRNPKVSGGGRDGALGGTRPWIERAMVSGFHELDSDTPVSPEADRWHGWGTSLKPAVELVCLARRPLSEGTVAANVLKWGCGAINVDGCRIETNGEAVPFCETGGGVKFTLDGRLQNVRRAGLSTQGRWPANVVHDGSDEVVAAFPESGPAISGGRSTGRNFGPGGDVSVKDRDRVGHDDNGGSAARFFASFNGRDGEASAKRIHYTSKADFEDRAGSAHPTIKPLDLIQYLCRLICPPGGAVLDPFAGTGTTGEAAWREGFEALLIEREVSYCDDIRRRMALALAGPDERTRESIKARGRVLSPGPLFDGWAEAAE